jgi:hypothetical protein
VKIVELSPADAQAVEAILFRDKEKTYFSNEDQSELVLEKPGVTFRLNYGNCVKQPLLIIEVAGV